MKVIIAGSRWIDDAQVVRTAIRESGFEITEIVCGMCRGVDLHGRSWAAENNIPTIGFPADWDKFGRAAGPIRNQEMAFYADALIAVWDGSSRGTFSMIKCAKDRGLKTHIHLM